MMDGSDYNRNQNLLSPIPHFARFFPLKYAHNIEWKNPITQYIRDVYYNVNWYLIRGQEEVVSYYYASILI